MTLERAKELLNQIIDSISIGNTCSETIKQLLFLGFTGEELYNDFGFSLHDVADAEEEYECDY